MRAAPSGRRIALANHRHEVLVADLDENTFNVVDRSDSGRTEDLAWSPDGAWLAYTFWTSPRHSAIKLFGVPSAKSTLVTDPEFRDYSPAFDPRGQYLYFLSLRTFDPVYDSVQFELSFPRAARPYLIALSADGRPPFEPEPRGMQEDDARPGRSGKPEAPAAMRRRPRRHCAPRRGVSGAGGTLRPYGGRGRRQGRMDASCRSPARTGAAATRICRDGSSSSISRR